MKRPAALPGEETSALESSLPPVGAGPPGLARPAAASGETILPANGALTEWSVDPEALEAQHADKLEQREVLTPAVETVKLRDVVPPIRFESGVADISPASVEKLRPAAADPDVAYAAVRPKINLDDPKSSRLVLRLREEFGFEGSPGRVDRPRGPAQAGRR